jgi:hypothetical protein
MLQDGRKLRNDLGQIESNHCHNNNYTKVKVLVFNKFKAMLNIKKQTQYTLLSTEIINGTNAQDGQKMALYTDGEKLFVREVEEFEFKFSEEA